MLTNILYLLAFICAILFLLALLGVVGVSWILMLVLAIVFAAAAYLLGAGRYGRHSGW